MNKNSNLIMNRFILIVLILLFVIMVLSFLEIRKEGTKCFADPFTFSAQRLETQNNAPVSCSCSILKGVGATMNFNSENKSLVANQVSRISRIDERINFSKFNLTIKNNAPKK